MRRTLLVVACVTLGLSPLEAADPSRKAIIEDTSGVKTGVTDLRGSFTGSDKFYGASDAISIRTPDFEIAIPTEWLMSIKVVGSSAEVAYNWHGQPITVSGKLGGQFTGKSDFGDVALSTEKLRQLTFTSPPSPTKDDRRSSSFSAAVVFINGKRVVLSNFQRHDNSFYPSAGAMGGSTRYHHLTDFRFQRGESLATLKFDAIRKLEFGTDKTVTVIVKNGNTGLGSLSTANDAHVSGWTGESDHGNVFISPESVQSVEFVEAPSSGPGAGKR